MLPSAQSGFTLIELVIVMVLLGIVGTVAMMANGSASVFTLASQAQSLSSDIRHVQQLATTWGKTLRITAVAGVNGTYSVSCANGGTSPCNGTSAVVNPATGSSFTVALQRNVSLSGPATLDINSLGRPSDVAGQGVPTTATTYTLSAGGSTQSVAVAALTGSVTVAP